MKTTIAAAAAAACTVFAFVASAGEHAGKPAEHAGKPMEEAKHDHAAMMPKAGAETKSLKPIFLTASWTDGKIMKGAHGPDSPEGTSKGKQKCSWVGGDLWVACDIEDTATVGKNTMTWKGHVIVGWDFKAKAYKSMMGDNMGGSGALTGKIEGTKLIMTSDTASDMGGMKMWDRLTWDWTDGKNVVMTHEKSMDGTTWMVGHTLSYKKGGAS